MNPAFQQFLSVALPIMVTLVVTVWIAQWSQKKRFDDLNRRIDELGITLNRRIDELRADMNQRFAEVNMRLDRIERKLENHEERLIRLEERTATVR